MEGAVDTAELLGSRRAVGSCPVMKRTTRFRELIKAPEILQLPCCHDALSAKVLEQAGYDAISVAGYGTAGSRIGWPDIGVLTATEMIDTYFNVCEAVRVPVFVDLDTGFGDVSNVIRAVRQVEQIGAAGLFIEDQTYPKRCGHMSGKSVVPVEDYVPKLRAALWARQDPDFVIMARTDSVAVYGFDEGLRRACLYADEGADMVFVEAIENAAEMKSLTKVLNARDIPSLANMVEGGKTPFMSAAELQEVGYSVVVYPGASVFVTAKALQRWAAYLKEHGTTVGMHDQMMSFDEYYEFIGAEGIRAQEAMFLQ